MKISKDDKTYHRAKKQVDELKGFYVHLAVFIIFQLLAWGSYLMGAPLTVEIGVFPLEIIFFGWAVGLAFHAIHVFGVNMVFGHGWEERKIKEFMEEEKRMEESIKNNK